MGLKSCRECGVPKRLSKGYRWPGNGAILSRLDPSMRMVIFEAGYFPHVWKKLEDRLHASASDLMIRGQQAAAWDYMEVNVAFGWRKLAMRLLPVVPVINRAVSELAVLGLGRVEVTRYRRGKLLLFKVYNPFDIISVIWGAKGLLQYMEGKRAEMAWTREDDTYTVSAVVRPGGEMRESVDEETVRSLREAKAELLAASGAVFPARREQERCPLCGVPTALRRLKWIPEEGLILHRDTGIRYVFTTGHVFVGVIKDLERVTGQDLEPMITEITKHYHLMQLKGTPAGERGAAYEKLSSYMSAFGFGEVTELSYGEGHLEMKVANPFYIPRLVGRVAAAFEHVEEQGSEASYARTGPGMLEIEVRTA